MVGRLELGFLVSRTCREDLCRVRRLVRLGHGSKSSFCKIPQKRRRQSVGGHEHRTMILSTTSKIGRKISDK